MRLRKKINCPQKLEDEIAYGNNSKDPTKPAFPHLLQAQVVPFDDNLPPATFPSLPFPTEHHGDGTYETTAEQAEYAQASSGEKQWRSPMCMWFDMYADLSLDDGMSDVESFTIGFHPKNRSIPAFPSQFDPAFEDEMATSDEDEGTLPQEHETHQPASAWGVSHGHLDAQTRINPSSGDRLLTTIAGEGEIADTVDWKDLRPAVQLAIISGLSDQCSMTKVFDMLGLYAQDVGGVRKLAARYNYQRELEDYLISSLQQDQRSGILRTDHTSTSRGAPEAYQEFQTRNYMTKIQAEVDEGLLQATRADINLGKRFLAQQGINPSMIGSWGLGGGHADGTRPRDHPTSTPTQASQSRSESCSGYVSARPSPDRVTRGQQVKAAIVSEPLINTREKRGRKPGGTSKTMDQKVDFRRQPTRPKAQQPQQPGSPTSQPDCLSPADDASVASTGGRSRRNVRRSSRYDEAIAELKLRSSGVDLDSDYEMSEGNNKVIEEIRAPVPSPKLLITADRRIIGVPAPSSAPVINIKPSYRLVQTNSKSHGMLSPGIFKAHSTTPERVASPLPLLRVVVRPPKSTLRPQQPNTVAQPSDGTVMNKFNQSLLGVAKEANNFTNSLLNASERGPVRAAKATPWIPVESKDIGQLGLPSTAGSRRRSVTITAPPFSPITERSDSSLNHSVFQSSPTTLPSAAKNPDIHGAETKSSLPTTPQLISSSPSELPQSTGNSRSIVTETGSPVPSQKQPKFASTPLRKEDNGAHPNHKNITPDLRILTKTPKPATSTSTDIPRKLDPVTGMVIPNHLDIQQPNHKTTTNPIQSSTKTHPPPPPPPRSSSESPTANTKIDTKKPNPLQAAGDQVKKAAFGLTTVATEITKTAAESSASQAAAPPPPPTPPVDLGTKNGNGSVLLGRSMQGDGEEGKGAGKDDGVNSVAAVGMEMGTRKKRKYVKSEKQIAKEAGRRERRGK